MPSLSKDGEVVVMREMSSFDLKLVKHFVMWNAIGPYMLNGSIG